MRLAVAILGLLPVCCGSAQWIRLKPSPKANTATCRLRYPGLQHLDFEWEYGDLLKRRCSPKNPWQSIYLYCRFLGPKYRQCLGLGTEEQESRTCDCQHDVAVHSQCGLFEALFGILLGVGAQVVVTSVACSDFPLCVHVYIHVHVYMRTHM